LSALSKAARVRYIAEKKADASLSSNKVGFGSNSTSSICYGFVYTTYPQQIEPVVFRTFSITVANTEKILFFQTAKSALLRSLRPINQISPPVIAKFDHDLRTVVMNQHAK